MPTYIALLRGINVSGQKKIKMAELREQLVETGFTNTRTYIQSGNVVFDTKKKQSTLAGIITKNIKSNYGFDVPVMILSIDDLEFIHSNNPYLKDGAEEKSLYVAILDQLPESENLENLRAFDTGTSTWQILDNYIYLHYPDGAGRSKLTNNLIERKLKVSATSRNWRSMGKILELAKR